MSEIAKLQGSSTYKTKSVEKNKKCSMHLDTYNS